MNTNEVRNEEIKTKKDRSQVNGFIVRIISTFFLLIVLAVYCGVGIAYQEVGKAKPAAWVDTFAYISLLFSAIISAYCTFEIVRVFKEINKWWVIALFIIVNLILFLLPTNTNTYDFVFYKDWSFASSHWGYILLAVIIIYFLIFVLIGALVRGVGMKKAMLLFLGSISIVFAFKGFSILMLSGQGSAAGTFSYITVLWLWLMVIFADSFAYLGGWKWGKHKMAPKISPKKTWEGAFVGVGSSIAAGILIALLLHFLANGYQPFAYSIAKINSDAGEVVILIILAIVFPIISVFGDLFFSLIKRVLNVKDYSNLIPGHGGALDRLDSFILVNAIAFILVAFVR